MFHDIDYIEFYCDSNFENVFEFILKSISNPPGECSYSQARYTKRHLN